MNVMTGDPVTTLFVYGTLQPGAVRWHYLEPFVADAGTPDSVDGQLFDTGCGYPAAVFDVRRDPKYCARVSWTHADGASSVNGRNAHGPGTPFTRDALNGVRPGA